MRNEPTVVNWRGIHRQLTTDHIRLILCICATLIEFIQYATLIEFIQYATLIEFIQYATLFKVPKYKPKCTKMRGI